MLNYKDFLFDEDGNLKLRNAPVVDYLPETDTFILKYSIPGYHCPRQYFKFAFIPEQFPNQYVAFIFKNFSITNSFLYRHPHNKIPKPKSGRKIKTKILSPEVAEMAQYNLNLAVKLGRLHHSLFYFDSYLEAYKILHPEIKRLNVKQVQIEFNKLISS